MRSSHSEIRDKGSNTIGFAGGEQVNQPDFVFGWLKKEGNDIIVHPFITAKESPKQWLKDTGKGQIMVKIKRYEE